MNPMPIESRDLTRTGLKRVAAVMFLGLVSALANAAPVLYSGTSTATFPSGPVASLSVTWAADVFDDSVVTGVGTELFDVALTSLTLSPNPLGSTTFTTINTGFQVHYVDGALFALRVGGLVGGGVESLTGGNDDFMVRYMPDGGPFQMAYRLASSTSVDGNSFRMTAAVTATPVLLVPEPASLGLVSLALGVAALSIRRRSKRSSLGDVAGRISDSGFTVSLFRPTA